jgi:hydrogenase/urease accessory protein HupE
MTKLFVYLFLFFVIDIESHEFNPAHLVIDANTTAEHSYDAKWMYPLKNIGQRAEIIFPEHCSVEAQSPYPQGKYLIEKIILNCDSSLKGHSIEVINLSVLTDALITINFLNDDIFEGLMNLKSSIILIPIEAQNYPTTYFTLGIDHLFSGIDHILFILGLLFLVTGLLNVIKTITAFTIAHSITLGLSVFDIISLPQATVEVLIALTIVYLALEINDSYKLKKTPWIMAFCFGLLHGLGFASALSDIGIANDQMLLSLLFFNLGIEAGQLALIPFFGFFIWLAHKYNFYNQSALIGSYALGGMGFYWIITRFVGIIS